MAEEKKEVKKERRPTAKKRDLQNEKKRLRNRSFKASIKTAVRSFEKVASEKNEQEAKVQLNSLYSLLDKAVKSGIYKLNKVSRLKSKYAAQI